MKSVLRIVVPCMMRQTCPYNFERFRIVRMMGYDFSKTSFITNNAFVGIDKRSVFDSAPYNCVCFSSLWVFGSIFLALFAPFFLVASVILCSLFTVVIGIISSVLSFAFYNFVSIFSIPSFVSFFDALFVLLPVSHLIFENSFFIFCVPYLAVFADTAFTDVSFSEVVSSSCGKFTKEFFQSTVITHPGNFSIFIYVSSGFLTFASFFSKVFLVVLFIVLSFVHLFAPSNSAFWNTGLGRKVSQKGQAAIIFSGFAKPERTLA